MDHVELKNTISEIRIHCIEFCKTAIENSKIIIRNFPKQNIKKKKKDNRKEHEKHKLYSLKQSNRLT